MVLRGTLEQVAAAREGISEKVELFTKYGNTPLSSSNGAQVLGTREPAPEGDAMELD